MNKKITIPDEVIINKIVVIRDQKVMIDSDIADLYGVTTKRLNEQVKRNIPIVRSFYESNRRTKPACARKTLNLF